MISKTIFLLFSFNIIFANSQLEDILTKFVGNSVQYQAHKEFVDIVNEISKYHNDHELEDLVKQTTVFATLGCLLNRKMNNINIVFKVADYCHCIVYFIKFKNNQIIEKELEDLKFVKFFKEKQDIKNKDFNNKDLYFFAIIFEIQNTLMCLLKELNKSIEEEGQLINDISKIHKIIKNKFKDKNKILISSAIGYAAINHLFSYILKKMYDKLEQKEKDLIVFNINKPFHFLEKMKDQDNISLFIGEQIEKGIENLDIKKEKSLSFFDLIIQGMIFGAIYKSYKQESKLFTPLLISYSSLFIMSVTKNNLFNDVKTLSACATILLTACVYLNNLFEKTIS